MSVASVMFCYIHTQFNTVIKDIICFFVFNLDYICTHRLGDTGDVKKVGTGPPCVNLATRGWELAKTSLHRSDSAVVPSPLGARLASG